MFKKSILLMSTVLMCTLEASASLVDTLGSMKGLLTGNIVPVGILFAAVIGFIGALVKANIPQAFSIIGVGILFAFFYAWVISGFEVGVVAATV